MAAQSRSWRASASVQVLLHSKPRMDQNQPYASSVAEYNSGLLHAAFDCK